MTLIDKLLDEMTLKELRSYAKTEILASECVDNYGLLKDYHYKANSERCRYERSCWDCWNRDYLEE